MSLTDAGVILLGLLLGLHYWLLLRLLGLLGRILGRLDALEQRAADSQAGQQAGSAVEPRAGSSAAATVSPAGRPLERPDGATAADEAGIRLNLGCGGDARPGWVNHDRAAHAGTDVAWDLRTVPWPIGDDTCAEIMAQDVLEHLPEVVPFMDECWRLLKPGGTLTIRAVLANSENNWLDPTHVRGFVPASFEYFDPECYWGQTYGRWYTDRHWKLEAAHLEETNVVAVLRPRKD